MGAMKSSRKSIVVAITSRPVAAKSVGLKDHSLREALRKPHVKAFYREQVADASETMPP
jgi:hypothetical protein